MFRSEPEACWENGIYKVSINRDYSKLGDLRVLYYQKNIIFLEFTTDEYFFTVFTNFDCYWEKISVTINIVFQGGKNEKKILLTKLKSY